MNALHDTGDVVRDERRTHADPGHDAHRRLRDSRFNMFRWPAFLVAWAVGGAAILLALIYMAIS